MSFRDCIEREMKEEDALSHKISAELKKIPHGELTARESKNNIYTKVKWPKGEESLGNIMQPSNDAERKRKIVSALTARHCMEEMQKALDHNRNQFPKILQMIRTFDPNELIQDFPKAYSQLTDDIFTCTGFPDYSKLNNANEGDDFRSNGRIHRTATGLTVRSRIEVAIADNYTARGFKYLYEEKLFLPDGTTLHPDFTVYVPGSNRVIYHEHAGLLDDSKYRESFLWKERKYIENGIYPNRELIVTTEEADGSIDMEKLNRIIDCFLY